MLHAKFHVQQSSSFTDLGAAEMERALRECRKIDPREW